MRKKIIYTIISLFVFLGLTASSCDDRSSNSSISKEMQTYYADQLSMDRSEFNRYCDSLGISSDLSTWWATQYVDFETKERRVVLLYITSDSISTTVYTNKLDIIPPDTTFVLSKKQTINKQ